MDQWLYTLATLAHGALVVALASALRGRPALGVACVLLVALGLVYDNGIIAAGRLIGHGRTLELLNWPRFIIHALATPLLMVYALELGLRQQLFGHPQRWRWAIWGLVAVTIGYGVILELLPLSLEPATVNGVVRYRPAVSSGPPLPALITVVTLIVVGVLAWRKRDWAWLAVGAGVSLVGFAIAPALPIDALGAWAEVALIGSLAATIFWELRAPEAEAASTPQTRGEVKSQSVQG